MPRWSPRAYSRRTGAIVVVTAIAACVMQPREPAISTVTRGGLTVITHVEPGARGVVAEAWVGGGQGGAEDAVAHLAEHVAIAQAGAAVVDGRVTPDATIVRAVAQDLAGALGPIWRTITATRAEPVVLAHERRAVAAEAGAGRTREVTATEVERHWRRAWRAQRATVVVHGRFQPEEVAAWLGPWAGRARVRSTTRRAVRGRARLVLPGPAPTDPATPAAAIAAAAVGATLASGCFLVDARALLRWPAPDDRDAWLAARLAAARLPIAGADGWVGAIAAAHHVVGDAGWPHRYRAAVAATPLDEVLAAARALERQVRGAGHAAPRRQARPAPSAPTRRSIGATRLVVARRDAPAIAFRWLWAIDGDGDRLGALAAAAVARCFEAHAIDGTGGRAEVVVERDRIGVRATFAREAWREGVAAIAACVRAPDLGAAGHERDRARLAALAAAVADSPIRRALTAFARATYGDHALVHDVSAAAPRPAAADEVAAWWGQRRAHAPTAIAAVGPLELDELVAAVAGDGGGDGGVAPTPRAPGRAPRPGGAELFIDGRADDSAVLVGFDALAAGDPDRAALDVLAALLATGGGPLALPSAGGTARVAVADTLDAGYLAIVFAHPPDRAALVAEVRAALAALASRPPSDAAVAAARAVVAARRLPSSARDADELALAELTGAPPRAAALAAVDAAAVARVIARVVVPARAVVVTVRPPDDAPAVRTRRQAPTRRGRGGRRR
ncbi:MAG: hypothetical protein IPL61_02675 [Myxococcales bacterium]|nr:hypothetical protein [Myxococcales bacterium]